MRGEVPYKKQALAAARQLGYGEKIMKKVRAAKNDYAIERIMIDARHEASDREEEAKEMREKASISSDPKKTHKKWNKYYSGNKTKGETE